jgi:hypothetical protein
VTVVGSIHIVKPEATGVDVAVTGVAVGAGVSVAEERGVGVSGIGVAVEDADVGVGADVSVAEESAVGVSGVGVGADVSVAGEGGVGVLIIGMTLEDADVGVGANVPVVVGTGFGIPVTVGMAARGVFVRAAVGGAGSAGERRGDGVADKGCPVTGGNGCALPVLVGDRGGSDNGVSVAAVTRGGAIIGCHVSSKIRTSRTNAIPVISNRLLVMADYAFSHSSLYEESSLLTGDSHPVEEYGLYFCMLLPW